MPLNDQAAQLLGALAEQGLPSADQVPLVVGRQLTAGLVDLQGDQAECVTEDFLVAGAAGLLPARSYRASSVGGTPPLIVYFHGGGWVAGDLEIVDRPLRLLALATGAVIVSVQYRRAPETRFPGPAEDAHAALVDLVGRADALGVDPDRTFVAGDSAGGNLAAVTALMARDRGTVSLAGQVLFYPVTSPAEGSPFASYVDNADGYLLTADAMRYYWSLYLADPQDGENPYAAPLAAPDLTGLPPALVITAEYDVLRDEGEAYAHRLAEAGVDVRLRRLDGTIHAFFWLPGVLPDFATASAEVVDFVRRPASESHTTNNPITVRSSS